MTVKQTNLSGKPMDHADVKWDGGKGLTAKEPEGGYVKLQPQTVIPLPEVTPAPVVAAGTVVERKEIRKKMRKGKLLEQKEGSRVYKAGVECRTRVKHYENTESVEKDYYYEDRLLAQLRDGVLYVDTAFANDPENKVMFKLIKRRAKAGEMKKGIRKG